MKISISGILTVILLTLSTASAPAWGRMDRLKEDYDSLGNITGKYLFPKEKGANLRILDINVWEWDGTKETLTEVIPPGFFMLPVLIQRIALLRRLAVLAC